MISREQSQSTVLFLTDLLENFGVVNFYRRDTKWKNKLQEVYCYFQFCALLLLILFHFLNTVTRSIHYVPHFLECLSEDVYFVSLFLQIFSMKCMHMKLSELMKLMDDTLSRTDKQIVVNYQKAVKRIIMATIIFYICTVFFISIETVSPLTIEETELESRVYGTKYPHRKLAFRMMIPLVDETETVNYILLYAMQAYTQYVICVYALVSFVLLPILVLYLKDQYTILGEYIDKIGQQHYDLDGNEVYFTNIDKHEYVLVGSTAIQSRLLTDTKNHGESSNQKPILVKEYQPIQNENKEIIVNVIQIKRSLVQTETDTERHGDGNFGEIKPHLADSALFPHRGTYQQNYVRQILRFHQNLLVVNEKICKVFKWSLSVRTTGIFVSITLILLQIISHLKTTGRIDWSFVFVLLAIMLQSYLSCILSDLLDECNATLCRSIRNSHWYECDNRVRKDVWILLRRVQRSNHLVFYRGVVVLRQETLVKFVKYTYSFINCVRAKTGF